MLDFAAIPSLIASLDDSPRHSLIGLHFYSAFDVPREARYLARLGVLGVVPLAVYTGGDALALRAVTGQPINRWPVVRVSHVGEGSRSFCSDSSRLMATVLLTDDLLEHQQALKTYRDLVLTWAEWLGDTDGFTRALITQLADESAYMFSPLPKLPLSAADPDSTLAYFSDVLARAASDGADSVARWRGVVERDASFAPAQALLLRALLDGGDDAAIRQTAWDVFTLNHGLDNVGMVEAVRQMPAGWGDRNPVIAAAQTLVERGAPDTAADLRDLLWPSVVALAADEDGYDGAAHLDAARALAEARQFRLAWAAVQNAAYWRSASQEAEYPEALETALDVARAWKQPALADVLQLAQAEKPSARPQPAAPEITLPREYEASAATKQLMYRMMHEDLALVDGDLLLLYRYGRWNFITQGDVFGTRGIASLAILTTRELLNYLGNASEATVSDRLKPPGMLSSDLQNDLHYKLRPAIADYHRMMEWNLIYIVGGATSDQMFSPQLEDEQRRSLTEKILTEGGYGWFRFSATWQEVAEVLDAYADE